jgi:hypothetical protein
MRDVFRIGAAALVLVLVTGAPARPSSAQTPAAVTSPFKALQRHLLAEEPMHERQERREFREHARELRRLARRLRTSGKSALHAPGASARPQPWDEDARRAGAQPRSSRGGASPSAARSLVSLGNNVRCNNPAADGAIDGQCETAIARWNNYMVAAWNDGTGFSDGSYQTQGWATSTDGGATWVDQGRFPLPAGNAAWVWSSDPVLAVNPTTGAFYFAALADPSASTSAVGVLKGRFTGASFAWGAVSTVRSVPSSTDFLDKEWLAVDPASGKVGVSYTEFLSDLSRIEFQYADSALTSWSVAQQVSPASENGAVQGSRPIFGPDGTIYVVYYLIGPVDADYYRICHSADGGATFSTPTSAVSMYANWGSGAPGFNRAQGIQFPSIAVDRSGGTHAGRLHLAWNESLNWYDDIAQLGSLGVKTEVEPNDAFGAATPLAVGQTASGYVNASSDIYDWYALTLAAGQGIIVEADAVGLGLTLTMRLYATDGATRLAFTQAADTDIAYGYHPVWLYAAPTAGTYYLRVADYTGSGTYRVATAAATRGSERGRDQRDVFAAYSDDGGATWSTPAQVNSEPAGYDDWLPEIAVTPAGQVGCAWYDWRDASTWTCGGESSIYLAASANGGLTWWEQGPVTNVGTAWTSVATNIVPNEGDYLSLFADAQGYAVAWSDGRNGNPDTYMAAVPPATAGVSDLAPRTLRLAASTGLASARLAFDLPGAGRARLAIFDLQGRKVVTLVDDPMAAGSHAADWNLADDAGQRVGTGIYWALLEAGGRRASARMVVLR